MNEPYLKHLKEEHDAKTGSFKGEPRIVTREYQVPQSVMLKLDRDFVNACWFCFLEDFEKVATDEKSFFDLELINLTKTVLV